MLCTLTSLETLELPGQKVGKGQGGFLGHNFTGPIPAQIGNLAKLSALVLSGNNLTGTLQKGLWQLTNLKRLELAQNRLTGSISASIKNLTNLRERLDLSGNELQGLYVFFLELG